MLQKMLYLPEGFKVAGCQWDFLCGKADVYKRQVVMYVLNQFYITPYNSGEEFYPQFYRRITEASEFAARSGIKTSL